MVTFKIDKPFTGKYLDNIEAERNKRKIVKLKKRNAVTFDKGKKTLQWESLFNHQLKKEFNKAQISFLSYKLTSSSNDAFVYQ